MYTKLHRLGELLIMGERVSNVRELLTEARHRWGHPAALVCDRWRMAELLQTLEALNFPAAELITRGQGFKDGGADVRAFRSACLQDRVRPPMSALMRHCFRHAVTVQDAAGTAKLAKAGEGGRVSRARDDVAAACILAVAVGFRSGVELEAAATRTAART